MFVWSLSLYNTIGIKVSFFYAKSRTCSFIVCKLLTSHSFLYAQYMHILHFRIGHVSFFLLLFCNLSLCNNLRISFLCISSIIALAAASIRENLLFHLSAIFCFTPCCFQNCQRFVKILNICFHILAVIATPHQFQVRDAGFL